MDCLLIISYPVEECNIFFPAETHIAYVVEVKLIENKTLAGTLRGNNYAKKAQA